MNLLVLILGIFFVGFALWGLLHPPPKRKDFSDRDRREATHRAMGGSAPPGPGDVIPPERKKR